MQKLAWLGGAAVVAMTTLSCGSEVRVVPSGGDGGGGSAGVGGAGYGGDGGVPSSSSASSGGAGGEPSLVSPVNSGMCINDPYVVGWVGTVTRVDSTCACIEYGDPPYCGYWHVSIEPYPDLGSEVIQVGPIDFALDQWYIVIVGYPLLSDGTCPFELEINPEDWQLEIVEATESSIVISIAATYPMSQIIDGVYTLEICPTPS